MTITSSQTGAFTSAPFLLRRRSRFVQCAAIVDDFVYVPVILDAWSRRVVGYAISRSIDVRLTLAALNAAIERQKPPPGCVHHSDSQRINASFRAA